MATKSHGLKNGWTLIADKSFKLFSNANEYILVDYENDTVLQFAVTDSELEVVSANWGLRFKVILGFKTIKVMEVPEEE